MLGQVDLQTVDGDGLVSLTVNLHGVFLQGCGESIGEGNAVIQCAHRFLQRSVVTVKFHVVISGICTQLLIDSSAGLILDVGHILLSQVIDDILTALDDGSDTLFTQLHNNSNKHLALILCSKRNRNQPRGSGNFVYHSGICFQSLNQLVQIGAGQIDGSIGGSQSGLHVSHDAFQIRNLFSILGIACGANHDFQRSYLFLIRQQCRQTVREGIDLSDDFCTIIIVVGQTAGIRIQIARQHVVDLQLIIAVQIFSNDTADLCLEISTQFKVLCVGIRAVAGGKVGHINDAVQCAQLGLIQLAHGAVVSSQTIQRLDLFISFCLQFCSQIQNILNLFIGVVAQLQDILHLGAVAVPGSSVACKLVLVAIFAIGIGCPVQAIISCVISSLRGQSLIQQLQQVCCVGGVGLTDIDSLAALHGAGGQNGLRCLVAEVVGHDGIQVMGNIGLAGASVDLGLTHDSVHCPLRIGHTVHGVVVCLLLVSVLRQGQPIAVRHRGRCGSGITVIHRIALGGIGNGISEVFHQLCGQVAGFILEMLCNISSAPSSLSISNNATLFNCSQNLCLGRTFGQSQGHSLRTVFLQLSRINIALNDIQHNIDSHIKHGHVELHDSVSNVQRILILNSRQCAESCHQSIQLGKVRLCTILEHSNTLVCCGPVVSYNISQAGFQILANTCQR